MGNGDWAMQQEQERQERLLNMPEDLGYTTELIESLQDHISELQAKVDLERSWKSKWKGWLISGLIGAVLGFGLSLAWILWLSKFFE